MQDIGSQLRRARQERGWTLETLSSQSGLSTGFLSQVERDQSTLSIVSLSAICHALEIPMERLFTSSGPLLGGTARVTKAALQLRLQIGDSPVSYRYLTPQLPDASVEELLIAEFPAGARQEATAHDGEELGYVLGGRLRLWVGEEVHALAPGDSFRVASRERHAYEAGKAGARILMAVTQRFIDSPVPGSGRARRTRRRSPAEASQDTVRKGAGRRAPH
jgi:transcriptional regulator with XRE-family HTH domain